MKNFFGTAGIIALISEIKPTVRLAKAAKAGIFSAKTARRVVAVRLGKSGVVSTAMLGTARLTAKVFAKSNPLVALAAVGVATAITSLATEELLDWTGVGDQWVANSVGDDDEQM